jgi:hypothetical protein
MVLSSGKHEEPWPPVPPILARGSWYRAGPTAGGDTPGESQEGATDAAVHEVVKHAFAGAARRLIATAPSLMTGRLRREPGASSLFVPN